MRLTFGLPVNVDPDAALLCLRRVGIPRPGSLGLTTGIGGTGRWLRRSELLSTIYVGPHPLLGSISRPNSRDVACDEVSPSRGAGCGVAYGRVMYDASSK